MNKMFFIYKIWLFVSSHEVMMYFPSVVSICFWIKNNPQTSEACTSRNFLLLTKLYPATYITTQREACIYFYKKLANEAS